MEYEEMKGMNLYKDENALGDPKHALEHYLDILLFTITSRLSPGDAETFKQGLNEDAMDIAKLTPQRKTDIWLKIYKYWTKQKLKAEEAPVIHELMKADAGIRLNYAFPWCVLNDSDCKKCGWRVRHGICSNDLSTIPRLRQALHGMETELTIDDHLKVLSEVVQKLKQ